MKFRADLAFYDENGQLQLIVEVKNRLGTDRSWATQMRKNLLEYSRLPESEYFILALPDIFYIWKGVGNDEPEIEPTYEIDPTPLLKQSYDRLGVKPGELSSESFELLIGNLLNFGILFNGTSEAASKILNQLEDAGLMDVISKGELKSESLV